MLEYYYDIIYKDQFKEFFEQLYIGKNPTKERNSYLVMRLSFGNLNIHSDVKEFEQSLRLVINDSILDFKRKYKDIFKDEDIIINPNDSIESLMSLTNTVQRSNYKHRVFSN